MTDSTISAAQSTTIRVWDIGVRLFHWSLVAMVTSAYVIDSPRSLHRNLGYVVVGLLAFRIIWGLIGGHHARFWNFVPGPKRLIGYLGDMARGREQRYLGHNPAGAAMIVALLCVLGAIGTTGYMMGMDAYFGVSWVEDAHKTLVDLLLVMLVLHIGGVVVSSRRHRENLVLAMITGDKIADDPSKPD